MRLLHTTELRFQDFYDDAIPQYVILSHRWGEAEVSYQEFLYLTKDQLRGSQILAPFMVVEDAKKGGPGFRKVQNFRQKAAKAGHEWVWIDTVCIDKSSSAELSEAINSMYNWYGKSKICYVYLSDVPDGSAVDKENDPVFKNSDWFKRGWTLQELIAPSRIEFFDASWRRFGTKATLEKQIASVTGIPVWLLSEPYYIDRLSVADRMSFACGRETSRREDRAYSLLGLFGISMPLLYGEGNRAFRRLQEEIIRQVDDQSIFVHSSNYLLADSVEAFRMHTRPAIRARIEKKPRSYQLPYAASMGSNTFPRSPSPATVTSRGVQLEGACFTFSEKPGLPFRLLLIDYSNMEDNELPVFLLLCPGFLGEEAWFKAQVGFEPEKWSGLVREKFQEARQALLRNEARKLFQNEKMYVNQ